MDNLHVRLNVDPDLEISKIAKFGLQTSKNMENIDWRSLRILYIFISRTEKVIIFVLILPQKW